MKKETIILRHSALWETDTLPMTLNRSGGWHVEKKIQKHKAEAIRKK